LDSQLISGFRLVPGAKIQMSALALLELLCTVILLDHGILIVLGFDSVDIPVTFLDVRIEGVLLCG